MTNNDEQIALKVAEKRREKLLRELSTLDAFIALLRDEDDLKKTIVSMRNQNTDVSQQNVTVTSGEAVQHIKDDESDEYPLKEGLARKFLYFIDKAQRFVHVREVARMIEKREGNRYDSFAMLCQRISSSSTEEKKTLASVKVGTDLKNIFWGHKEWLNPDGTIKAGYEYNKEEVS